MKNVIIIILSVLCFSSVMYAQNDSINSKKHIFPIEIGIEINYTNDVGYGFFIMSNIVSKNKNSILFGVKYVTYSKTFSKLKEDPNISDNSLTYFDIKDNIQAFEFPLLYRYTMDNDVFLNFGFSYGLNFKSNFTSGYYKTPTGIVDTETSITNYNYNSYGNIIGGLGFQKMYNNYGYKIGFNFSFNSLALNISSDENYFQSEPNLSNINISVAFIIK